MAVYPLKSPSNSKSIASVSRQAVIDLLERLQLSVPQYTRDFELEHRVKDTIRSWGPAFESLLRPYLPPAMILTLTCYDHIKNVDTKVQIALFSTLVIAMDDPSVFNASSSRDFHRRLCAGSVQGQPDVLGKLTSNLAGMWEHFPPFAASSIFTAALQFVNGCILEQNAVKGAVVDSDALPFITYRRNMSGLAEAFAYFIWEEAEFPDDVDKYMQAIPDICWYQNHVNDVLSFYKEELAGETGNYMSDRAIATGKTTLETLQEVIDETVVIVERIRKILGEGKVRDAWEAFARGWIAFHTSSPRYRLRELIPCHYIVVDGLRSEAVAAA
ncbi:terpenoid synthase [Laetiporus sulphureus 93-53]|uniref:Terpenoid synthase n=1 Tax=Laetiporus sulphureus 93-53 TaxID=1314785 RepID=A0A165HWV2_9APHY|nr:terpenoid synthase [Laetiporus sulphureus 93-53]KZT12294.1 terpenoid synthase [Laetiporus sulphureus 93-53]